MLQEKITPVISLRDKLDTTYTYHAGAVTARGKYFLIIGRDPVTEADKTLYRIRLDPPNYGIGQTSLLSPEPIQIEDLAFSPVYGTMRGFDNFSHKLVDVRWLTGLVTNYSSQTASQINGVGAMFFDQDGNLFGYGSKSGEGDGTFLSINNFTGVMDPIKSGLRTIITDGCACPYTVPFVRKISPEVALPCETVRLSYVYTNRLGSSYENITLRDTLPPEMEIISVIHQPAHAEILQTANGQIVAVQMRDFLLGRDSLVLEVQIQADADGLYPVMANLGTFPAPLGTYFFADEGHTNKQSFEVKQLEVNLGNDQSLCFGEEALLNAAVNLRADQVEYLWDDGSSGRQRTVSQTGWYSVEVMTDCQYASDSVYVRISTEALSLDAGQDQHIKQGESAQLSYTSNVNANFTLDWVADPAAAMSCTDCPSPETQPLETTTYTLTLTDEFGCTITDELIIHVDKTRGIRISNVFSPNGDGINDFFYLESEGRAQIRLLSIYNRWGNKVFEAENAPLNDPKAGWDGTIGRKILPPGVYFWYAEIIYPDQTTDQLKGNVLLVR